MTSFNPLSKFMDSRQVTRVQAPQRVGGEFNETK